MPPALAPVDKEKVAAIVEVCNVSTEEALRVLDACHMDETMAIERFLSGKEVATWSEVSKKKKPPAVRPAAPQRRDRDSSRRDRDRDRDPNRRPPPRSSYGSTPASAPSSAYGSSYGNGVAAAPQPAPVSLPPASDWPQNSPADDAWGAVPQPESWPTGPSDDTWGDPNAGAAPTVDTPQWGEAPSGGGAEPISAAASSWGVPDSSANTAIDATAGNAETRSAADGSSPMLQQGISAEQPSVTTAPNSTPVKRNFNYAAAAAAGTSHAKPTPVPASVAPVAPASASAPSAIPSPIMSSPVHVAAQTADLTANGTPPNSAATAAQTSSGDSGEVKKRRSRGGRKHRARQEALRAAQGANGGAPAGMTNGDEPAMFDAQVDALGVENANSAILDTPSTPPNAWAARAAAKEKKQIEDSAAAVAVAAAAVVGSEPLGADSLSLQFGSFGLSGLDGVNWSASEQKPTASEAISASMGTVPTQGGVSASAPVPGAHSGTATLPVGAAPVSSAPSSMPTSTGIHGGTGNDLSNAMSMAGAGHFPGVSGSTGSGLFPVLPVGATGAFPPPNYGTPYMMPAIPGYSPALQSYENGSELGNSRSLNVGPNTLPLYDPSVLSGKYGAGLGDSSGVPGSIAKDMLPSGGNDGDKSGPTGTAGLPIGMDPLAPAYVMPGYPSMQYPMYSFPTGPYAPPPGMGPPGPSPFPYPPTGQVSSQGSYGGYPGQGGGIGKYGNANAGGRGGFGFDDGTGGQGGGPSRNASGLGESMYTPAAYMNPSMSDTSGQKGLGDGGYKGGRSGGNVGMGGGVSGMGMSGGGMVPPMPYNDYAGGVGGANVAGGGGVGVPGNWNNRQGNNGRLDTPGSAGMQSNQSMSGTSGNSGIYAPGPGAPGGYWPQQGGYY